MEAAVGSFATNADAGIPGCLCLISPIFASNFDVQQEALEKKLLELEALTIKVSTKKEANNEINVQLT
jgi:hypothetical protein